MKSRVYKERIIKLKKEMMIQGALKSYVSLFMMYKYVIIIDLLLIYFIKDILKFIHI